MSAADGSPRGAAPAPEDVIRRARATAELFSVYTDTDEAVASIEAVCDLAAALVADRDALQEQVTSLTISCNVAVTQANKAERDRDALQERAEKAEGDLRTLRGAWNAHFERCETPLAYDITMEDLERWRNAPSDTASVGVELGESKP